MNTTCMDPTHRPSRFHLRGARAPALALLLGALGAGVPLGAQEPEVPETRSHPERCICLPDPGELRFRPGATPEGLEEAMERMREGARTARLRAIDLRARARLGLELAPDPGDGAAVVAGVTPGSSAEAAGLREGDRILRWNGHDLERPLPDPEIDPPEATPRARLLALGRRMEAGDTVEITFRREEETRTAVLEARRGDPWGGLAVAARGIGPEVVGAFSTLERGVEGFRPPPFGFRLADLNPGLGAYFDREEGVLVLEAPEGNPFDLRPGDVVVEIDGRPVRDAGHAGEILRSYRSGETVRLRIWREGGAISLEGIAP